MKIVAFLQNQWFKDPERIKRIIQDTIEKESHWKNAGEIREYYISAFLFMGCLTGQRLMRAFGDDTCHEIVWEECSREIGGKSSAAFPADIAHMQEVVERHAPQVLLVFGKIAKDAVKFLLLPSESTVITGPHPAARGPSVVGELAEMARRLQEVMAKE